MTAQMKSLAANRLTDGITVWAAKVAGDIQWTENWADVTPATTGEDIAALEAFAAQEAANDVVVSERLLDVLDDVSGGYTPQRMRERIVTAGPTMRLDLGKQAEFATRPAVAA